MTQDGKATAAQRALAARARRERNTTVEIRVEVMRPEWSEHGVRAVPTGEVLMKSGKMGELAGAPWVQVSPPNAGAS